MAKNRRWTDEEVEVEIARLNSSEYVKLARREQQIKNRRRQYMWTLQYMESRGKQLASEGITHDNMEAKLFGGKLEVAEDA
jgi:chemotaxis receptor (MCP) glutamine deamidase CheD